MQQNTGAALESTSPYSVVGSQADSPDVLTVRRRLLDAAYKLFGRELRTILGRVQTVVVTVVISFVINVVITVVIWSCKNWAMHS